MRDRIVYILQHYLWIQKTYRFILSRFFRLLGFFIKRDDKLILFSSFVGKRYNDSPKVLFEIMRDDPFYKDYKFVWAFVEPEKFDIKGSEKVKLDTWAYFKTAIKAKTWICSVNIERGLTFKPKGTIYVNTWHGAGTKKIGNACANRKDYDLSTVDMMLVQSRFEQEIFERDFQCRRDAIRITGFPRNDELFHITEAKRQEMRRFFNIPEGKKVILYAPTWRDSKDGGLSYKVEPPIDLSKWKEAFADEYVMLFRMHPFTTIFNMQYDEFARDTTTYDNLNHILAITDVLITDYSTIVYDSAVAGIPFICFGFDYERYNQERGFYYDLNEVYPGGVKHTEEGVIQRIKEVMNGADADKYAAFRAKYIEAGGNATETVLKELKEKLKTK